jgi:hypothetical protein
LIETAARIEAAAEERQAADARAAEEERQAAPRAAECKAAAEERRLANAMLAERARRVLEAKAAPEARRQAPRGQPKPSKRRVIQAVGLELIVTGKVRPAVGEDGRAETPTNVFICYRRDDSAGYAGRIHDRLAHELGREHLFMDVDAIPFGMNFVKILRDEVAKCGVLLTVMGPKWGDVCDEDGSRRLDNSNDFVRIEIATALRRNIPVIPILLDGAKVPKADRLPKDLEEFAQHNGLDVRHASFHIDMDKLVKALRSLLGDALWERNSNVQRQKSVGRAGSMDLQGPRLGSFIGHLDCSV